MRLVFDLESDNLLDNVSKIYCTCAYDLDTDTAYSFKPDEIDNACQLLEQADVLIGHNIINYDLAVIEKLYGLNLYNKRLIDTILLSKLFNADIEGGHSLSAWGDRLGFPKGDHNDWSAFSEEMLAYCEQDVRVTTKLYQELSKRIDVDAAYVRMEHKVAIIQHYQEVRGVMFDKQLCLDTLAEINAKIEAIDAGLEPWLGYKPVSAYKTTMKPFNKDGSYSKKLLEWVDDKYQMFDVLGEFTRIEWEKISLSTEKLLKERLIQLGWKPTLLTPTGQPKLAEKGDPCSNLAKMGGEFAAIGEYQVLKHRKGLLEGLLQVVRPDGAIPSEADVLGAATGRYTHRKIVNMPAVRSPYGETIRAMFKARDGYKFVGVDLSGIEARMLAHYMNDAEFTDTILNGDIHTFNQHKAGLPTRDAAKTFFYAYLYGASDLKIGHTVGLTSEERVAYAKDPLLRKVKNQRYDWIEGRWKTRKQFLTVEECYYYLKGYYTKSNFYKNLPSLASVINYYQDQCLKGYIVSLDGRRIRVRTYNGKPEQHKALNVLLQSSATIYFKGWMVFVNDYIKRYNLDCYQLISMHDELQFECKEEDVESLKEILEGCIKKADKYFDVKCPNACEVKVGLNWRDTH